LILSYSATSQTKPLEAFTRCFLGRIGPSMFARRTIQSFDQEGGGLCQGTGATINHLGRAAVVYVRQSTMAQVTGN
jgi:hypothetical protein